VVQQSEPNAPEMVMATGTHGKPLGTVKIPRGWWWRDQTATGLVLCHAADGRIALYSGGSVPLPSCPVASLEDGQLLFVAPGRRALTDSAGRTVVRLRSPLPDGAAVFGLSSGQIVVARGSGRSDVYGRGGDYLSSAMLGSQYGFGCRILSASRNGRTILAVCGTSGELAVGLPDGGVHQVRDDLASFDAVLSADGRYLAISRDTAPPAIVLDARTLEPLYRLDLPPDVTVASWAA
jgi:hypothetical protein